MRIIYEYEFEDGKMIQLPANADIIKASPASFWAVVDDTEKEMVDLKCVMVKTGTPLPEDMSENWIYLDTFFDLHHYLVLKEKKKNEDDTRESSETAIVD